MGKQVACWLWYPTNRMVERLKIVEVDLNVCPYPTHLIINLNLSIMKTLKRICKNRWDNVVYLDEQNGVYYVDIDHVDGIDATPTELYTLSPNEPDGEPCWPLDEDFVVLNPYTEHELWEEEHRMDYMILGKIHSAVDEFFNRPGSWAYHSEQRLETTIKELVKRMRERWESFPSDHKPQWLTMEDINAYEELLKEWEEGRRNWLSAIISRIQINDFKDENAEIPVDIVWETGEEVGLSSLDMQRIINIHQMVGEGYITFKTQGSDEIYDLDDYPYLVDVFINYLEENF